MAVVYFDASALVKLLNVEIDSDFAAELWNSCDVAVSSRLAYPEVRAALGAAGRNRDLTGRQLVDAEAMWEDLWGSMRPVELTRSVERRAGELAVAHSLRGADAVHLASALAVGDPDLVVAAWDRRLHRGASAERLAVAPSTMP